ncbi:MAG: TolC family protein [Deltaproteobacteria bacterium]|nr:TolC family protein [Deltaproteobacteria bacterium]
MRYNKREIIIAILLILMMPLPAVAADLIIKGEMLTLDKCIEIAQKNHPSILAAEHTVKINQNKAGEAKSNYYPQINWNTGYSRSAPALKTSSQSTETPYNDYSSSLTLSQNIYDFEKTATQVEIQTLNTDSSQLDLTNVTREVVFGVKQSYYGLLRALKTRDVNREIVNQFQQHLDQAKEFFRIGIKAKFDVTKAEVDLSNAKINLLTAENSVKIAKITLNNAMGILNAPEYDVENNLAFQQYDIPFEEAMKEAYQSRPDLLSLLKKKESIDRTITLAKKGYYPTLSGNASYGFEGRDFPLDEGWNIAAIMSFPLFSGFLTTYQVEEALANLDVLKAHEDALRQSIQLDVQQATLNLQVAKDIISTAELTVKQAEENLEIANGRYTAGIGNPIEVTDALVALSNAKMSHIAALHDYKMAHASLEKAIGIVQ